MSKPVFFRLKVAIYDIIEKECAFSFHMIYHLYFYALSIQSYGDRKKLLCLTYAQMLNREKRNLMLKFYMIQSNLKRFLDLLHHI